MSKLSEQEIKSFTNSARWLSLLDEDELNDPDMKEEIIDTINKLYTILDGED